MQKRFYLTLILALVSTCSLSSADTIAPSYLAICQKTWPCAESLSVFDGQREIRTGWLMQTFADNCPCARKVLHDPRPKVIRIHLANSACLRNGRCGRYEVFAGETVASATKKIIAQDKVLLSKFRRVTRRTKRLLNEAKGSLQCYISPCLECDLNERARKILGSITHVLLPNCNLVDSVVHRPCLRGYICEKHGPLPSLNTPCISDLDGSDFEVEDTEGFLQSTSQCLLRFVWGLPMNCNKNFTDPFIDPRKRICKWPSGYTGKLKAIMQSE